MKKVKFLNEKEICEEYENTRNGIEYLSKKYHVGKLRIKEILDRNHISHKKRGKQSLKERFVIDNWKIKKYQPKLNKTYIAIDRRNGFKTNDYENKAGILTTHIKNIYNIEIPTLYDRRLYYMRTGNYWWEQWFEIKEININNITNSKNVKHMKKESIKKNTKIWGYLRETSEIAKKDGNDPTTGLCRTGLEEYLKVIFPNVDDWIHDKSIGILNGEKCKFRPDYRSETLKMIVEMDGLPHYTSPQNIVNDEMKTKRYEDDGYTVIRIPYFIQLSNDVVKQLFGVNVDVPLFNDEYSSMGIKNRNTPAYLCPLGIKRMAKEFKKFPKQYQINLLALQKENNILLTGINYLEEEYNKLE